MAQSCPGVRCSVTGKLKMLGIELKLVAVDSMGDLQSCAEDALGWMRLSMTQLWDVKKRLSSSKRPASSCRSPHCILSEQFAEQGALMTVSVEPKALGAQAASIARQILVDKVSPKDIGIRAPMAGQLTLNLDAAQKIQLSIAPEIMLNINRVIGAEP